MQTIQELYKDYPEIPYISSKRDLLEVNTTPKVPKRNMIRTKEGVLPGHIILLWRIHFGTFTTETPFSKYFEYSYGVNGADALSFVIEEGDAVVESAFDSLDHIPATRLKQILKEKGVKGLSKMKRSDVDATLKELLSEEELGAYFSVRGLCLTPKGEELIASYPEIIAKHPQKKF